MLNHTGFLRQRHVHLSLQQLWILELRPRRDLLVRPPYLRQRRLLCLILRVGRGVLLLVVGLDVLVVDLLLRAAAVLVVRVGVSCVRRIQVERRRRKRRRRRGRHQHALRPLPLCQVTARAMFVRMTSGRALRKIHILNLSPDDCSVAVCRCAKWVPEFPDVSSTASSSATGTPSDIVPSKLSISTSVSFRDSNDISSSAELILRGTDERMVLGRGWRK